MRDKPNTRYIWLFIEGEKTPWRFVESIDDRLDWEFPFSPKDEVFFVTRRGEHKKWRYAYWGESRVETAAKANAYSLGQIAELERRIAEIRARLVQP